jgi:hypothetical protein
MYAVTLPNGKRVSLGAYTAAWRAVKAMAPDTEVNGWNWYPVPARYVLNAMRAGLQDRINKRGGLVIRNASESRIYRRLKARVKSECRECGCQLGRYEPKHGRFCGPSCRSSFWS